MNLSEEKTLLRSIKDEPGLFAKIFDAYYKTIFNYIFRRVGDYDISRDIAADTFLKAYLKIHSFIWKDISVLTWLYRIATNEVNYYYRKNRSYDLFREKFFEQMDTVFQFEDYQDEKLLLENELNRDKDFARIQKLIKQLDIKYQEVLSLRYFEKKPINEIAEILKKKEGTVKSLISRGLEKLKNRFNNAT